MIHRDYTPCNQGGKALPTDELDTCFRYISRYVNRYVNRYPMRDYTIDNDLNFTYLWSISVRKWLPQFSSITSA